MLKNARVVERVVILSDLRAVNIACVSIMCLSREHLPGWDVNITLDFVRSRQKV